MGKRSTRIACAANFARRSAAKTGARRSIGSETSGNGSGERRSEQRQAPEQDSETQRMDERDIAAEICEKSNGFIYVSDIGTNELLYLNEASRRLMHSDGSDYRGKACHLALYGLEEPCPFCTNDKLSSESTYCYQRYSEQHGRYLLCRDKLIELDGKLVRLQIADDTTPEVEERSSLEARLAVEETLVRCARTLSRDVDGEPAINGLLRILGEFYNADRAYVFESTLNGIAMTNTYEWCADGIIPEIDNLQNVPLASFDSWVQQFDTVGMVHLIDIENTLDHDTEEYGTLAPQGIDSLIVVPLYEGGGVMRGMLGVDNPRRNTEEYRLLRSLTYFVQNDLEKRQMLERLNELSHVDSLTGIGNRTSYLEKLIEYSAQRPASLGVVFADINDLKLANDTRGHSYGDRIIRHAGRLLDDSFPECVFRIGGDEFVAFAVDLPHDEFKRRVAHFKDRINLDSIVNVSVGAVWSDGDEAPRDLVAQADALMYEDKKTYHFKL